CPCPPPKRSALYVATMSGQFVTVEIVSNLLLLAGADKDALGSDGDSALMWAAWHGRLAVVETLLTNGADVNLKSTEGWTPLLHATMFNTREAMLALLRHGAIASTCDDVGRTPL
ncbi:unnamed protein product, partial [Ectocarpus sp. 8 AP-2014]